MTHHVLAHSPNYGDSDSLLTTLYETYSDSNCLDNDTIKRDFAELFRAMNGKQLWQKDEIVYPVCVFCRDHEKTGFAAGVKVGVRLRSEIADYLSAVHESRYSQNTMMYNKKGGKHNVPANTEIG